MVGRRPLRFDGEPYSPAKLASTLTTARRTSFALLTYANKRLTGVDEDKG
jgi:hypothetical protein